MLCLPGISLSFAGGETAGVVADRRTEIGSVSEEEYFDNPHRYLHVGIGESYAASSSCGTGRRMGFRYGFSCSAIEDWLAGGRRGGAITIKWLGTERRDNKELA